MHESDRVKIIPYTYHNGMSYVIAEAVYIKTGIFKKRQFFDRWIVNDDLHFHDMRELLMWCDENNKTIEGHYCV